MADGGGADVYTPPLAALLEAIPLTQQGKDIGRAHLLAFHAYKHEAQEIVERAERLGVLHDARVHPEGHRRVESDEGRWGPAWERLEAASWPKSTLSEYALKHVKHLEEIQGAAAEVVLHSHLSDICPQVVPRLLHVRLVRTMRPELQVVMEKVIPLGPPDFDGEETTLQTLRGAHTALRAVHSAGVLHRDLHVGNMGRRASGGIVIYDYGMSCGTVGTPPTYVTTDSFLPYSLPQDSDHGRDWAFFCAHTLLWVGDALGPHVRAYFERMACAVSYRDGALVPLSTLVDGWDPELTVAALHMFVHSNHFPHAEDEAVAAQLCRGGRCDKCDAPRALCVQCAELVVPDGDANGGQPAAAQVPPGC